MTNKIIQFFKMETSGAILLIVMTALALIISNSPWYPYYNAILTTPISIYFGTAGLDKPVLLWINDGLMAIFFCMVAIEIKRKIYADPSVGWKHMAFPGIGAAGGVLIPALIYILLNYSHSEYIHGWAVPTATDIAFSLGILMLLGDRVPASLKLFLIMLAVMDDLSAIVVIALFYTGNISLMALALTVAATIILFTMNYFKVKYVIAYIWVGIFVWICMIQSGVHATLTGVFVGFALPMGIKGEHGVSPSLQMEHELKHWVNYMHLPIFAFANAGVPLTGVSLSLLLEPLPMGIALGLFIGKPLGVFSFVWGAVRIGWIKLPDDLDWQQIFGVAMLAGVGFTMSLFIGTLAFGDELLMRIRIGVLTGSFIAAVSGYMYLHYIYKKRRPEKSDA